MSDENSNPYEQNFAPSGMYNPPSSGGYNPPSGGGYNPPASEDEKTEHTYWKRSGSIEYDADDLLADLKGPRS